MFGCAKMQDMGKEGMVADLQNYKDTEQCTRRNERVPQTRPCHFQLKDLSGVGKYHSMPKTLPAKEDKTEF